MFRFVRPARFVLGFAVSAAMVAAAYDPPAGYYAAAAGLKGAALKEALHERIKGHTALGYAAVYGAIDALDEDPADAGNVLLLYSGYSVSKTDKISGSNDGSWNREHTWPLSLILGGGNTQAGAPTDLFHLYACDADVNNRRANLGYDQVAFAPDPEAPWSGKGGNWWTPRDADKGRVARGLFYMAVRYESEDAVDLELGESPAAKNAAGVAVMGRLSTLLKWHREFPSTEAERLRNHRIYTNHQRNRNPFIDNPLFADQVFSGDTPFAAWRRPRFTAAELGDSAVAGDTADPDGDGVPNRLEFALNLDPRARETAVTAELFVTTVGGQRRLGFSHRRHRYATDLVFHYETSGDLVEWAAFAPSATATTYVDASTDRVTVETPLDGGRRFIRLRVERP